MYREKSQKGQVYICNGDFQRVWMSESHLFDVIFIQLFEEFSIQFWSYSKQGFQCFCSFCMKASIRFEIELADFLPVSKIDKKIPGQE